jgi:hypothetical protein
MSTNGWVHTFLGTTRLKSFIMHWLHWKSRQNSCRLSHSQFLCGYWPILTINIFGVIECAKLQSPSLLRKGLLLNLGIMIREFLFDQNLFVSIYIVFFVRNLSSEECKFTNLSFFHGYGREVSGPQNDLALYVPEVLFCCVLFKRNVFVFRTMKLFSGILSWFEIEIVASSFKTIFLDSTQSSRRPLLIHITNAKITLS